MAPAFAPKPTFSVEIWTPANGWEETCPWGITRTQAWEHCRSAADQPLQVFSSGKLVWENDKSVSMRAPKTELELV